MDAYIEKLLKQLTLKEKIGMIHGDGLFKTKGVARLGIPPFMMSDGPMGVRQEFENDKWIGVEGVDDFTTYLPSGSAIASSWNRRLAYIYGHVLGEEARGRGKDMILAPSINIMRSPLCGRNFEYLSEDPYLTSEIAVPMVKGIQSRDVSCCVKHFAAHNQETNRMTVDAIIEEKTFNEIYLRGFKACVDEGHAYALMGAYNKVNGEHASQSKTLLNTILRDRWHFNYMVVSDWFAVHDTKLAAESGIDIEMSVTPNFDDYFMANPLLKAIENGEINESFIDDKIRNILKVMIELKMIGEHEGRNQGSYNTKEHQMLSYEIAKETIVLLKNDDHLLPLSKNVKKVLLIGDNAIRTHADEGGSAEIKALFERTPLEAIKDKLGPNCQVDVVAGYFAHDAIKGQAIDWQISSVESIKQQKEDLPKSIIDKQKEFRDEAVRLASSYDQVIILGGLNHKHDLETRDRLDIVLPYAQDALIEEVLKVNPNTVVYLLSGAAVNMGEWHKKAKSILWSSYNGMHGADALSDVLYGDVNPSGKLTQTFAEKLLDYPSHSIGEFPGKDKVHYNEGEQLGYRHFQKVELEPLFPFGFGLSYTTFSYKNLLTEEIENAFIFSCDIKNIGAVEGKEIIQLYANNILKGFVKIHLQPDETHHVSIKIKKKDFDIYDVTTHQFIIKEGTYKIGIGSSSNKILLETVIEV